MKAIMVMYDSLNRRLLQPYGCDWTETPNFLRLAQHSVRFDNHYANSLPCMPARRELHTGRYNFLHRSWGPVEPFDDSMPELLKQNGIHSQLMSDHWHYWRDGGATYHNRYSGWEVSRGQEGDCWKPDLAFHGSAESDFGSPDNPYVAERPILTANQNDRRQIRCEAEMPMVRTFDLGLEFLERNHDQDNFFLQIETFDPHEPFYLPPDLDEDGVRYDWPPYYPVREGEDVVTRVRERYARLLKLCDAQLGRVLDRMDAYDMWKDTMLIVNTDHGFLLGEHGWWGKSVMPLYNDLTNTPLFVHDPRFPEADGTSRDMLTENIDLAPTVLEFFGVPRPDSMSGAPLRAAVEEKKKLHDYALFGIHGGYINITDGRYVYMLPPATPDNEPLNEYTVMPTHHDRLFSVEELRGAAIEPGCAETKGVPVLRIPRRTPQANMARFGAKLFDNKTDRAQLCEIRDPALEKRMLELMLRALKENHCPREQYERMGLPCGREELSGEDYEEILRRRAAYAEQSELAQLRLSPAAAATYRVLTAMLPYLAEEAKDKLNALCEGSFVDAESMERLLLPLVHNEDRAIAIYYARLNGRTI